MGALKKKCKTFGCPNLHRNVSGYCDECEAKRRASESAKEYEKKREPSHKRGYDWTWRKFARDFLKEHPKCAICGADATCVDHKDIPADVMMDAWGSFDYDPAHYQALCASCNARKGRKEDEKARQEYKEGKEWLKNHS